MEKHRAFLFSLACRGEGGRRAGDGSSPGNRLNLADQIAVVSGEQARENLARAREKSAGTASKE